jgi:G protein-coupled receptor GPR1
MLRQGPNVNDTDSSSTVFLSTTALGETGMEEKRDRIRQNTRQLFVYPVVYLVLWFFPLLAHILGGEDRGAPFAIVQLGLLSMCLHGACDALVFCWKEKPWRHVKTSVDEEPFRIWTPGSSTGANLNVGRTQEERLLDRKLARKRRDEEMVELKLGRLLGPSTSVDWWDRMQEEAESSDRAGHGMALKLG